MDRADEFQRNAALAEERAVSAKFPEERDAYLKIAKGWRDLIAVDAARKKRGL